MNKENQLPAHTSKFAGNMLYTANEISKLEFNTLHEIFEEQVNKHPKSVAIIFERNEITYEKLDERANRLANYLRTKGVQRGSLVSILLHKSIDVYVVMLATLKAGAAYVPLDPEYPIDRIAYIFKDSGSDILVTDSDLAIRHAVFCGTIVRIDVEHEAIDSKSCARPDQKHRAGPNDLCYIIYTSGSTGRPKGVQIEHHSACNLVLAEGKIYHVRPEDRVCQAASLSFDLSVEEIWLAFHAGATLIVARQGLTKIGPDFSKFLVKNKITVLSCVPTLLAMLEGELPDLRLVILGGESCPGWLVERWTRPERRLLNTYGPTEATVIATCTELMPGKSVTIGKAIPGYQVYILDDHLRQVSKGTVGQICIGGVGVARGYVKLDDETRSRFVRDPFVPDNYPYTRMYLTGDLGRVDSDDNLEFVGRIDSQVKIRGFRVELSEIESVMMKHDGVQAAACTVREDTPGIQHLVGYIIPRVNTDINIEQFRLYLRERLPPFMMPSMIETIDALPLLPSGKLDRNSLPIPHSIYTKTKPIKLPNTSAELKIFKVWETLFQPQAVSIDDNFFLDLGGHSLLAARMVSEIRKDLQFSGMSVVDIYEHPTIESLAMLFNGSSGTAHELSSNKSEKIREQKLQPIKRRSLFLASIIQTISMYGIFGFRVIEWVTPYLVFFILLANNYPIVTAVAWAAISSMVVFPLLLGIALVVKWTVLGRVRPGQYPLWGSYYLRWWFTQSIVSSLPLDYLAGTPLLPFTYKLFGVKIANNVHMDSARIAAFDLISIGENSSIDNEASLLGYTIEDNMLVLGGITIGSECFVGTDSVLRNDTTMERGSRLEDLSLLPRGMRIPEKQTWAGSPARLIPCSDHVSPRPPVRGLFYRTGVALAYIAILLLSPVILLAAIMPGIMLLASIHPLTEPFFYLPAIPFAGATFVFFIGIEVAILKWIVAGRVRAGTYPVHGSFYIRNWFVHHLLALSLDLIAPLHATLYVVPWYRALGAKIGKFVELSTAATTTPDLLEIEDDATIADEVSLGVARVENGWMTVRRTKIGHRTFLGNSAVVPEGTVLGDESLVGVLSLSPKPVDASRSKTSWLGSPPILLPKRQASFPFSEKKTFRPTRKLRFIRSAIELCRVTLPTSGFIVVATIAIMAFKYLLSFDGLGIALLTLPITYAACCISVAFAIVLAKWAIVGRFKPFAHPLWSTFIWRLEFVNALYEFLATPLILEVLRGTQLLPLYLRLLGAKIGRKTCINTTGFLEFDLIEIGDHVTLNEDCVIQTHLFEDRVLKAFKVRIGSGCNVGEKSVVLYDSEMKDAAKLDALSLLMKGESLPAGTSWAGIPAKLNNGQNNMF